MHILEMSTVYEREVHLNDRECTAMTNFNWKDVLWISVHECIPWIRDRLLNLPLKLLDVNAGFNSNIIKFVIIRMIWNIY